MEKGDSSRNRAFIANLQEIEHQISFSLNALPLPDASGRGLGVGYTLTCAPFVEGGQFRSHRLRGVTMVGRLSNLRRLLPC